MHHHRTTTAAFALIALATLAGCKKDRPVQHVEEGEIAQTWSPSGVSSVMNVPASAIAAEINKRIEAAPPPPLTKDTWSHARSLYKQYRGIPLWLTGDGLDKPRAGALMLALADGTTDGLLLNAYPLVAL